MRKLALIARLRKAGLLSGMLLAAMAGAAPGSALATGITEFTNGLHADSDLGGITPGPDGNLWFTDGGTTHAIGRITPEGKITEFTSGLNGPGRPADITLGPDKNLWFTETGSPANAIGRITPAGTIAEFSSGLNPGSAPSNIVAGPGGNLWFLDDGSTRAIGRITPAGTINEFSSGLPVNSQLNDLTVGPDGNLWFTEQGDTKAIGKVTPDGTITEFKGPLDQLHSFPNALTAGADGNVWFSDDGSDAIGRVTPSGTITEFTNGLPMGSQPDALTVGPDGNVWFNDQLSGQRAVGRVKRSGAITEFRQGLNPFSLQDDITAGADGNLWIEQSMPGGIARISPSGDITQFNSGLNPGAGADGDQIVSGPDGNLWFTDNGTTKAIGRVALQLSPRASTGPAIHVSDTTATVTASINPLGAATKVKFEFGPSRGLGRSLTLPSLKASGKTSKVTATLAGLSPGTVFYYRIVATNDFGTDIARDRTLRTTGHLTTAKFGNQKIVLATPSSSGCTKKTSALSMRLTSTALSGSHKTHLHFLNAALFIDKGVRHGGKRKANRVVHHLPATLSLKLSGLRSGTHTLKVVASYREKARHGHHSKVVSKTLKTKFRVC